MGYARNQLLLLDRLNTETEGTSPLVPSIVCSNTNNYMRYKTMKKIIAAIAMLAAFFFALGTVGSFAAETITFAQCAITVGICSIIEGVALKILD